MILVRTPYGNLDVDDHYRELGWSVRSVIRGLQVGDLRVQVEADIAPTGKVTKTRVRHYTWSGGPTGSGSGRTGADVEHSPLRTLIEDVLAELAAQLHRSVAGSVRTIVEVVVVPAAPVAGVAALIQEATEGIDEHLAGEPRYEGQHIVLPAGPYPTSAPGPHPLAVSVATALADAGIAATIHCRTALQTVGGEVPRELTTSIEDLEDTDEAQPA